MIVISYNVTIVNMSYTIRPTLKDTNLALCTNIYGSPKGSTSPHQLQPPKSFQHTTKS